MGHPDFFDFLLGGRAGVKEKHEGYELFKYSIYTKMVW